MFPGPEAQILLKSAVCQYRSDRKQGAVGLNLFSTGTGNTIGAVSTQQFPGAQLPQQTQTSSGPGLPFVFSDLPNIFPLQTRPESGRDHQSPPEAQGVLQILAEPNVLALKRQTSELSGREASSTYPVAQGSALVGTVT